VAAYVKVLINAYTPQDGDDWNFKLRSSALTAQSRTCHGLSSDTGNPDVTLLGYITH